MTHGTWQTSGGGGGGLPKELIMLAVVGAVMAAVFSAVAAAVAAVIVPLLIAVAVFAVAAVAGGAYAAWRLVAGRPLLGRQLAPLVQHHVLAPEPKKALPQPTTLIIGGQHVHVQAGTDLSALTEALRQRDAITITPEEN